MQLLKSFVLSFEMLFLATTICFAATAQERQNSARVAARRYVVPGVCSVDGPGRANAGGSASFVSKGGRLVLQLTGNCVPFTPGPTSGWEVFDSHAGSNPGTIIPTAASLSEPGIYTFTVSGLPETHNFLEVVSVNRFGSQWYYAQPLPISNGPVSVAVPSVGYQPMPTVVYFWISNLEAPLATIWVSDFKVNGTSLALDTTHTDSNSPTPNSFAWCWNFPGSE